MRNSPGFHDFFSCSREHVLNLFSSCGFWVSSNLFYWTKLVNLFWLICVFCPPSACSESADQVSVPPPEGSLFTAPRQQTDGQTDTASLWQGHPDILETTEPCRESTHSQQSGRLWTCVTKRDVWHLKLVKHKMWELHLNLTLCFGTFLLHRSSQLCAVQYIPESLRFFPSATFHDISWTSVLLDDNTMSSRWKATH